VSIRKTRSDKGKPRKPPESDRERMLDWFASQDEQERCAILRDMALIQRYAPVSEPVADAPILET
jgi:hypothetical protein